MVNLSNLWKRAKEVSEEKKSISKKPYFFLYSHITVKYGLSKQNLVNSLMPTTESN